MQIGPYQVSPGMLVGIGVGLLALAVVLLMFAPARTRRKPRSKPKRTKVGAKAPQKTTNVARAERAAPPAASAPFPKTARHTQARPVSLAPPVQEEIDPAIARAILLARRHGLADDHHTVIFVPQGNGKVWKMGAGTNTGPLQHPSGHLLRYFGAYQAEALGVAPVNARDDLLAIGRRRYQRFKPSAV